MVKDAASFVVKALYRSVSGTEALTYQVPAQAGFLPSAAAPLFAAEVFTVQSASV